MPTWRRLRAQRVRWYRGAIENLRSYGFTRVTAPYWGQQLMLGLSGLALSLYLLMTALMIGTASFTLSPFWLTVGGLFVAERLITVWRAGWRSRLLSLLLIPEMIYDIFLQMCFLTALWRIMRHREQVWIHGDEGGEICTTLHARPESEVRPVGDWQQPAPTL